MTSSSKVLLSQTTFSPFSDPSPFEDAEESVPIILPNKYTTTVPSSSSTSSNSSPVKSTSTTPRKQSGLNHSIERTQVNPKSSTSTPNKSDSKSGSSSSNRDKISPNKGKGRGLNESTSSKKGEVPFDVIDRLDISGLYSIGGSFHRHDGPYAAATAARNKGPRAPIGAFDPSALAPPPASSLRPPPGRSNSTSGLSPRAAATLYAMDMNVRTTDDEKGPYGVRKPLGTRRVSESSVTMGFPSSRWEEGGKEQQLIEIYGVRENEAWEDFSTSRYYVGSESHASSKDSIDGKTSIGTAQSIWDIEATLRAGRPVAQVPPPPPPVPILTADPNSAFSDYVNNNNNNNSNKPKRSKSLAARFRAGRRNPNNPMTGDDLVEEPPTTTSSSNNNGISDGREAGKSDFGKSKQFASSHELGRKDEGGDSARAYLELSSTSPPTDEGIIRFVPDTQLVEEEKEGGAGGGGENEGGIRFVDNGFRGSSGLKESKSLGMEDSSSSNNRLAGASQLGRKKSVMQRLFGKS